ncbi:hypothetical protein [Maritalea porphyrae]|uniref:hypothetical protein n=1 Tax=Maritalea porphyrae TaxID=880732 RepID=UPI0022AF61B0|nr:hypothetical protein [Maritalea porphyrae]MCZ4270744.1 hypothetical protein [Maritalea porphyrae]
MHDITKFFISHTNGHDFGIDVFLDDNGSMSTRRQWVLSIYHEGPPHLEVLYANSDDGDFDNQNTVKRADIIGLAMDAMRKKLN